MATRMALASAIVLAAAASAQAAFVSPTTWSAGVTAGSTVQRWDVFGSLTDDAPGNTGNEILSNSYGTPRLTELSSKDLTPPPPPGVLITSGGNIYAPTGITRFSVNIPVADTAGVAENVTALVQVRTIGNEMDYASFLINGVAPVSQVDLLRGGSSQGGGTVEHWLKFNVPNSAFDTNGDNVADALTLTFKAANTSASLDVLRVDTISAANYFDEPTPIPEPATLGLLGLGGLALLRRKR